MSYESVQAAHDALLAALRTVPGVRAYGELSASADPPAVYLHPPELTWGGPSSAPTEAVFSVALVVDADDRTTDRLYRLLPRVSAAIDGVDDVVLRTAEPGAWTAGDTALPCYFFRIEVAL